MVKPPLSNSVFVPWGRNPLKPGPHLTFKTDRIHEGIFRVLTPAFG